jgi:hypothetical protein
MSDYSSDGAGHHVNRVPKAEFFVYFSLIFTFGLVPQTIGWLYQTARHAQLPEKGPVARAWADAAAITPQIFRG